MSLSRTSPLKWWNCEYYPGNTATVHSVYNEFYGINCIASGSLAWASLAFYTFGTDAYCQRTLFGATLPLSITNVHGWDWTGKTQRKWPYLGDTGRLTSFIECNLPYPLALISPCLTNWLLLPHVIVLKACVVNPQVPTVSHGKKDSEKHGIL